MIRAASTPRFSNPDDQAFAESLADGKVSAVSCPHGMGRRYFPTVAGHIIADDDFPHGHDTNHDAVKRGQVLRQRAKDKLAEANGSA